MKKKTKVLVTVIALLLVLPLTVFTIVEESGFFDTRSSASDPWEECEYSKADLDGDGEVSLSDFHIWMNLWKEHEACEKDISKCRVGCVDSMHGNDEDDSKKENPGPIEAENPNRIPCSKDEEVSFGTKYDSNRGLWSYTISGRLRSGCLSVRDEAEIEIDDSGDREIVSVVMIVDDSSGTNNFCTTAMAPFRISDTFTASKDATVNCYIQTVKTSQKSTVK